MIITKKVSIILNPSNISYYENLGYYIPRYINSRHRTQIKRGTKILVKVKDLQKKCSANILCKCDNCDNKNLVVYRNLRYLNGKYLCHKCAMNSENCKKQLRKYVTGQFGPNSRRWDNNILDDERTKSHRAIGLGRWRKYVKERDTHTCQTCGSKENLHAHHINNFKEYEELRTDVNNGITLCFECHKSKNGIHSICGTFTTENDLSYFKKLKSI